MDERSIGYRPTWAEINLDNLAYNFLQIKNAVGRRVKIMACVKAESYGHGLVPVAKQLVSCGVDHLAVACVDEAVALRKSGVTAPVLVLGVILARDIDPLFDHNITPTVCSLSLARALSKEAGRRNTSIDIHIKVDTGMTRIGVMHHQAYEFVKKVYSLPNISIQGIFTHLACADSDESLTKHQIALFEKLVKKLEANSISVPLVHAANSMGVVAYKKSHFNMVRPGLILYGIYPASGLPIDLRPVMSLKTKVIYIKDVPKGCGVSYGHTYVTKKNTSIATLPIGYGDGYPRNLSNIGPVLINSKKFKIAGRICMDQIMVDAGNSGVKLGDEAVLIGSQGNADISAEYLAELGQTIPYEIVCGIGSRVPRVYIKNGSAVRQADAAEKRRYIRRSAKIPVVFTDMPSGNDMAVTQDISERGMRLLTSRQITPYRSHDLRLELRKSGPVYASGVAVWSRPDPKGHYESGIRLDRPLPSDINKTTD